MSRKLLIDSVAWYGVYIAKKDEIYEIDDDKTNSEISRNESQSMRSNKIRSSKVKVFRSVTPAFSVAILSKLACPACWPAYAAFLNALGLGIVSFVPYLLPLTVLFMLLSLAPLWLQARSRGAYYFFIIGVFAAATVIVGKFFFLSDKAMYAGLVSLAFTSILSSRWALVSPEAGCPACAQAEIHHGQN